MKKIAEETAAAEETPAHEAMPTDPAEDSSEGEPHAEMDGECMDAIECLKKAEMIKSDKTLMAKIKPQLQKELAALNKVDSSLGLDGLRQAASKRISELA